MKTWKPLLNTFLISEAHGSAWHMGLEKKYRLHIPTVLCVSQLPQLVSQFINFVYNPSFAILCRLAVIVSSAS